MPSVPAQNKARVTLAIGGVDIGAVMTKEGGAIGGETLKIRPAGGDKERALSSVKTYENVTVSTLYTDDIHAKRLWIDDRCQKAEMIVSEQPLDADDNPFGPPSGFRGLLVGFTSPNRDANANSEAACSFEMSVESLF